MRLYPPVTAGEATSWLTHQAALCWGEADAHAAGAHIGRIAAAMAAISAAEVPDEIEPLPLTLATPAALEALPRG